MTTGTIGRGVATNVVGSSISRSLALRAGELWIPSTLILYEHEFGAASGTGTNERGATYKTTTFTTYTTTRRGFLRVSSAGVRYLDLHATQRRVVSDVRLWDKDDGTPEGTYTFDVVNRIDETTVTLDKLAPDARDGAGVAKGASGWVAAAAMPNVVSQTRLLALNHTHIDRYALDGTYQGRVFLPSNVRVTGASTALSNLGWLHVQQQESTATSSLFPWYMSAANALSVVNNQNQLLTTFDDGETWQVYAPVGTLNTRTWSGYSPLFPV